jgi:hypothetical protein
MLMIRGCETCGRRIRSTLRRADRSGQCPYCKAELPVGLRFVDVMAPTGPERTIWALGLLTEAAGVVAGVALLIGHERVSMSWLGAGLAGAILAFLLVAIGREARIGSPEENITINTGVLIVMYAMIAYGASVFSLLDALGGSAMVVLSVFAIVATGSLAFDPAMRSELEKGVAAGWLILIAFVAAYAYHALQSWLGH